MKTAIGLMSGTSMDGIDVALVRSDGEMEVSFGPSLSFEFEAAFRNRLSDGLKDALAITGRDDRPGDLRSLEVDITDRHAVAVERFMTKNNIEPHEVDLIGFHGQTVLHRPDQALTVQLGLGQRLADKTGIDVVYDMRAKDMTVGGQGAPLVPVFHRALTEIMEIKRPICFVNIGGISNVTYVDDDYLIAFDTGPGNALIDQWMQRKGGIPFDQGGRIASEGSVVHPVLDRYLAAPFFDAEGPKSLDRNDFPALEDDGIELSDGARTLARLTAEAILRGQDHMPQKPKNWLVCGGGRLNHTIMGDLRKLAGASNAAVWMAEDLGLQGDMVEAQAFAYLAIRAEAGAPLTYPTTTGCREAVTGGVIARAK